MEQELQPHGSFVSSGLEPESVVAEVEAAESSAQPVQLATPGVLDLKTSPVTPAPSPGMVSLASFGGSSDATPGSCSQLVKQESRGDGT